ncbi:hypothetical protein [Longimicrobium sp.]|uniref:hypothetical protein n=1 Tax=Longimicrobium sp. TaxID=2029185 RepID=UPI002CB379B5|nr:hypothetical protein [Longimicrobium sp.]HSU15001.1 hypothetical protein [Longimicrobium sp.]
MFGVRPVARAGLETGVCDRFSIVMEQGGNRLVLTSGVAPDSPIARHAALHGDGAQGFGSGNTRRCSAVEREQERRGNI